MPKCPIHHLAFPEGQQCKLCANLAEQTSPFAPSNKGNVHSPSRTILAWKLLFVLIIIGVIAGYFLAPKSCYKEISLTTQGSLPVFQSSTVKTNSVRITKLGLNVHADLLHYHNDDSIILNALAKSGFTAVEIRYENHGVWYSPWWTPYRLAKPWEVDSEIKQLKIEEPVVIRYSLIDRPDVRCELADSYIEDMRGIRNYPAELLENKCIISEYTHGTAPYEIILSDESTKHYSWQRIQIKNTANGRLIANHYESIFDAPTMHGGSTYGCFDEAAKLKIMTSTIFSETGEPFIAKTSWDETHYLDGPSTKR